MLRHIELKVENRECCLLTALISTPLLFVYFVRSFLGQVNKLVNSKVNGRCWLCNAHRPPKVLGTPLESPMDPFSRLWRERETVRRTSFIYEYLGEKTLFNLQITESNIPLTALTKPLHSPLPLYLHSVPMLRYKALLYADRRRNGYLPGY